MTERGNLSTDSLALNDVSLDRMAYTAATAVEPTGQGSVPGTVRIAPGVLIELIEMTVVDIPGVIRLQSRHRVGRALARPGETARSFRRHDETILEHHGIRARLAKRRLDLTLTVVIAADTNIALLTRDIRHRVAVTANRMLGLTVGDVDIFVAGIEAETHPGG